MVAVTICSDFRAPQNKVYHCFHCFPIYLPGSNGPDFFLSVTHLVNASQNLISGLLILYPVFFANTVWCFLLWAIECRVLTQFLLMKASNFRRQYVRLLYSIYDPKNWVCVTAEQQLHKCCFVSERWLVFSPMDTALDISAFCKYHNFRLKFSYL